MTYQYFVNGVEKKSFTTEEKRKYTRILVEAMGYRLKEDMEREEKHENMGRSTRVGA